MTYNVYLIDDDRNIMVAALQSGEPVEFYSEEEAWGFVDTVMAAQQHPRLMWIKETEECKSLTT